MARPVGSTALRAAAASLAVGFVVTYAFAWYDLIENGHAGGGLGAVPESVGYWFGSVLPYWWLPLLLFVVGSVALAVLWRAAFVRVPVGGARCNPPL